MAVQLPPLTQRLAAELAAEIDQVKEPYRTNLLLWLNDITGREMRDLSMDLAVWFAELEGIQIIEQYALVRDVCKKAKRYFGLSENRMRRR
jgi:hypothetical protein